VVADVPETSLPMHFGLELEVRPGGLWP
jgi:hypothetical protein